MAIKHRLFELQQERELREHRQISIAEIAEAVGVSRFSLYNWLNRTDMYRFDVEYVEKLCRYFGVGLDDFFYFDPPLERRED